jgi:hypothetical protein
MYMKRTALQTDHDHLYKAFVSFRFSLINKHSPKMIRWKPPNGILTLLSPFRILLTIADALENVAVSINKEAELVRKGKKVAK